mmetsp:Transcript_6729/g.19606  ORF Transcript_6729/g.19606 Transcript_6729/m.19606 type:complete len:436 (-) Transcript_6729:282-1589(-)
MHIALSSALQYTSATLSVCGASSLLIDRVRHPEPWTRPARRLLFWLTLTDLFTAIAYMLPSPPSEGNSAMCQSQAIIGMFFPIASFCWTDCIALYVYLVMFHLNSRSRLLTNPKRMFFWFHVVSWGVAAVCTLTVALTGHAGRGDLVDASWCWIHLKGSEDDEGTISNRERTELLIWTFIGGKGVEWFSFAIWCPVLYSKCFFYLSTQERFSKSISKAEQGNELTNPMISSAEFSPISVRHSSAGPGRAAQAPPSRDPSGESPLPSTHWETTAEGGGAPGTSPSFASSRRWPSHEQQQQQQPVTFTFFKWKLFLVPIIFFILRMWGSVRVLLIYADPTVAESSIGDVLLAFQLFCDPAQGFFNGLLFNVCGESMGARCCGHAQQAEGERQRWWRPILEDGEEETDMDLSRGARPSGHAIDSGDIGQDLDSGDKAP